MAYLNLTKDLTKEGAKKLKVGQVMMFDFEGSPVYLKVMRKEKGQVYAKKLDPNKFLKPEDADENVTVVPKNRPNIN